jgi:hypothetical protein
MYSMLVEISSEIEGIKDTMARGIGNGIISMWKVLPVVLISL